MVAAQRQADNALRRAAILINHLDADNRRRLLAHFPAAEASRLRSAAASLSDVDPLEVRRVVTAFLGKVSVAPTDSAPHTSANGTDSSGRPDANTQAQENPRSKQLHFLSECSDVTLVKAVEAEHPQTIAVVLASLPAEQAARLLKRLPSAQRSEAIRRLGRLDEVPQEVMEDIGRHLKSLIGNLEPVATSEGRRTLTSILSALGDTDRQMMLGSLADSDGLVASALADIERDAQRQSQVVSPQLAVNPPTSPSSSGQNRSLSGAAESTDRQAPAAIPARTTAEVDALLESLSPRELQRVLAGLDARVALLTLCGLSQKTVKRLLRSLPRRQVKEVQSRMEQIGAMDFAEIEEAKFAAALLIEQTSSSVPAIHRLSPVQADTRFGSRRAA